MGREVNCILQIIKYYKINIYIYIYIYLNKQIYLVISLFYTVFHMVFEVHNLQELNHDWPPDLGPRLGWSVGPWAPGRSDSEGSHK